MPKKAEPSIVLIIDAQCTPTSVKSVISTTCPELAKQAPMLAGHLLEFSSVKEKLVWGNRMVTTHNSRYVVENQKARQVDGYQCHIDLML